AATPYTDCSDASSPQEPLNPNITPVFDFSSEPAITMDSAQKDCEAQDSLECVLESLDRLSNFVNSSDIETLEYLAQTRKQMVERERETNRLIEEIDARAKREHEEIADTYKYIEDSKKEAEQIRLSNKLFI